MEKKFEELQDKVETADQEKLTGIIQEVEDAAKNGDITEEDQITLVDAAKKRLGDPFSGYNI